MKSIRLRRPLGLLLIVLTACSCSGLVGLLDRPGDEGHAPCASPDAAVVLAMTLAWESASPEATDTWLDAAGHELSGLYANGCPPRHLVIMSSAALQQWILSSGAAATSTAGVTDPSELARSLEELYRLEIAAYASRFPELSSRKDLLLPLATTHRTRTALRRLARELGAVTSAVWLAAPVVEPRSVVPSTAAEDAALFAQVQAPDAGTTWVAASTDTEWRVLLLDHRGDIVDQVSIVGRDPDAFLPFRPLDDPFEAETLTLPFSNGGRGGIALLPVAPDALSDPATRAAIIDKGAPLWMVLLTRQEQSPPSRTASWFRQAAAALLADKGPWLITTSKDGHPDEAFASGISPSDLLEWLTRDSEDLPVVLPSSIDAQVHGTHMAFYAATIPTALLPSTTVNPMDAAQELAAGFDRIGNLVLLWSALIEGAPHLYHAIYDGEVSTATRFDSRIAAQTTPQLLRADADTFALWSEELAGAPRLRYARWGPDTGSFTGAAALVTRSTSQRYLDVAPGDPGLALWVEHETGKERILAATVDGSGAVSEVTVAAVECTPPSVLPPAVARHDDVVQIVWHETRCRDDASLRVTSTNGGRHFSEPTTLGRDTIGELAVLRPLVRADRLAAVEIRHFPDHDILTYFDDDTEVTLDEAPLIAQLHTGVSANGVPLIYWLRGSAAGFEVVVNEPEGDLRARNTLYRTEVPVRSLQVDHQQDGRYFVTGITASNEGPRLWIQTDLQ